MEKYFQIIKHFVRDQVTVQEIENEFSILIADPSDYINNSSRMLSKLNDYLWLGMVDLLIKHDYAFEVDWKEDYEFVQELLNKLFIKHNIHYEPYLNIDEDIELDEYFSLVNKELAKQGSYRVIAIEIDSDSYVSAISKFESYTKLKSLDQRIEIY